MPTSIKVIIGVWVIAIVCVPIMRLIGRISDVEEWDWLCAGYAVYALIVCIIFTRVVFYVCEVLS